MARLPLSPPRPTAVPGPERVLIDRGGTFTDIVSLGSDGALRVEKLLSSSDRHEDAALHCLEGHAPAELRMGTTVATNALLERRGGRVLLLTTKGFADLLEIGHQDRPDIFALQIRKRALLHAEVREIDERIRADGTVERAPDPARVRAALAGFDTLAVVLLHACSNPAHELLVERLAREAGCAHVALSHRVDPGVGAVSRGDTTVVDAYLTPLLQAYTRRFRGVAQTTRFLQSSGGLTDAEHFSGKDAVFSGPAGGVVAVARLGEARGEARILGLDMGGTSTDVCRYDGAFERTFETVVAGVRIRAPMLRIVTVAAGGGSLLALCDGRFRVGPKSAGADPGPACYGRGGPPTLTDANLVLGRILPRYFPHLKLDADAARQALSAFGDPAEAAAGFVRIADENMAGAIRRVTTERGHDPRDHALCCFGGAGGQHACALARLLGIRRVILHPLAGVLSAWGLGQADVVQHAVAPVLDPTSEDPPFPDEQARSALVEQGCEDISLLRTVDARYAGTDDCLSVPWSPVWRRVFATAHRQRFGFDKPGHPIELVQARVEAVSRAPRLDEPVAPAPEHAADPAEAAGGPAGAPVYRRADLAPGARFEGPAVVVEDQTTTWVAEGFRATLDGRSHLVLEDLAPGGSPGTGAAITARRNPVSLEVMSNRFMAVAEHMGDQLRRVAHSVNIKERRDFSCALFDPTGGLVANAPHIPVHLGAMGETVRRLLARREMRPRDAWLTNDPYEGGSHLPDLTVISPVFRDGRLAFLVANRGHHADVGGPTPGSMPAHSTSIHEEGVRFAHFALVRDGRLCEAQVLAAMRAAGVRNQDERLADLRAQLAANAAGVKRLDELCAGVGLPVVQAWMGHVKDHAAQVMRDVIAGLQGGSFEDGLDDGSRIRVSIHVEGDHARVDFCGTSPQQPGNRNAPRAVTVAAVLYVFRTLARRPIPLNEGCLEPLEIVVPKGSLLDPAPPAAVVGGNVETSQRVVDVVLGALGKLAACQGTMNNVTFGDDSFGYYETVCGGAGAGFGFDGASAVQTHMTNTRITDPEVLEHRHPVLVREFALRRGSGGEGVWRGGDGVVRRLEFERPLQVSVLAERRASVPFGLRAAPGARGLTVTSPTGLTIHTPGGGGYSPSPAEWAAMDPGRARTLFRQDRWRGPSAGIATGYRQASLLVVQQRHADRAAGAGPLLHRSVRGDPLLVDAFGRADLSTDLPLYRDQDGREVSRLDVGPEDVFLLFDADQPPDPGVPHRRNAPGRRFLTDRPRT